MCDIAYVLWWGRVEREHLALMSGGADVSTLDEAQQAFDADLAAPPARRDRVREATLRVFSGRAA